MTDPLHAHGSIEPGAVALEDMPLTGDRKAPPPGRVTWEQFLAWSDEDAWGEWVDGKVVQMAPSNLDHQDEIGFLYRLIAAFVEARQLGRVFVGGALMRLANRPSGRIPDLLFVLSEHADRLHPTYIDGPADLVVEIVSPESDARDHGDKFVEYEAAGIPEYWLIDPIRRHAFFYELGEDMRYRPGPIDKDGYFRSTVLTGFRLRIAWLWQRPLPAVADVTRELGV